MLDLPQHRCAPCCRWRAASTGCRRIGRDRQPCQCCLWSVFGFAVWKFVCAWWGFCDALGFWGQLRAFQRVEWRIWMGCGFGGGGARKFSSSGAVFRRAGQRDEDAQTRTRFRTQPQNEKRKFDVGEENVYTHAHTHTWMHTCTHTHTHARSKVARMQRIILRCVRMAERQRKSLNCAQGRLQQFPTGQIIGRCFCSCHSHRCAASRTAVKTNCAARSSQFTNRFRPHVLVQTVPVIHEPTASGLPKHTATCLTSKWKRLASRVHRRYGPQLVMRFRSSPTIVS